jgi:hypothetical protein
VGSSHRLWRDEDIRNIVKHEIYVGRLHFNVNSKSPHLRKLEPVYVYREELKIVPAEVFERNQRLVEQRRTIAPRSKGFPHAFSGVVHCPNCGGKLHGHKRKLDVMYECERYIHSGHVVCPAFTLREAVVKRTVMPILEDLIRISTGDHLKKVGMQRTAQVDEKLAGEIRAELQVVEKELKNLMRFAREGAITPEQLREENQELLAKRQRLESDLLSLDRRKEIEQSLLDTIKSFDSNISSALEDLIKNPLRFNTFFRLFFAEITLDTENKGSGWRKGLKKTDLRVARVVSFRFNPLFDAYLSAQDHSLPPSLQTSTNLPANQTVQSATGPRAYGSHTSPRSRGRLRA